VIGTRTRQETATTADSRAVVLQAASLLLGYPDAALVDLAPTVVAATGGAGPAGAALALFCGHLQATPLDDLQAAYVDTFDLRRRCCLYLTYFSHGDTRKRGMALLRFSHAYRTAGVELAGDELPDHLSVVCEFAATGDARQGQRLLVEHRAGLELIRRALAETASPYLHVLDAICAVLPAASQRDLDRALELARTGPPEEEVGLEPYGPPESMGGRR
jgi:nitrate reductase delta subunit